MLPYFFISFCIFILLLIRCKKKKSEICFIDVIALTIISLFSGLRGNVGPDTANYRDMFDSLELSFQDINNTEPLFFIILYLFKYLELSSSHALFFISILQGILIYRIAKILNNGYFIYVFYSLFFYNYEFNIIRQSVATLVISVWFSYAINNKKANPLIYILIASSIQLYIGIFSIFIFLINKLILLKNKLNLKLIYNFSFCLFSILILWLTQKDLFVEKFAIYLEAVSSGGNRIGPTIILLPIYVYLITSIINVNLKKIGLVLLIFWILIRLLMGYHELFGRIETFFAFLLILVLFSDKTLKSFNLKFFILFLTGISISLMSIYLSSDSIEVQGVGNIQLRSPFLPYKVYWNDDRL